MKKILFWDTANITAEEKGQSTSCFKTPSLKLGSEMTLTGSTLISLARAGLVDKTEWTGEI